MSENWIKTLSVYQIPDGEAVDFDVGNNNFCPPYPDCIDNPEPFTDVNNNGIWDVGEPFEDINESGYYDEDQIGYQNTSECPED